MHAMNEIIAVMQRYVRRPQGGSKSHHSEDFTYGTCETTTSRRGSATAPSSGTAEVSLRVGNRYGGRSRGQHPCTGMREAQSDERPVSRQIFPTRPRKRPPRSARRSVRYPAQGGVEYLD
jgi:hypothetical protein